MIAPPDGSHEVPIVMTATVIPQDKGPSAFTPEERLAEYEAALTFYLKFAPVFFLENSGYPLEQHSAFRETSRLQVRRFRRSASPEKGKGHQEFEMLDTWLAAEKNPPPRWLKITGRYQFLNLESILEECRSPRCPSLLMDRLPRRQIARTYSFCVASQYYRDKLQGLYQQCDDRTGAWVERVLFQRLRGQPTSEVQLFKTQARIQAASGVTGLAFPTGRFQWGVKQMLRRANRLLDRQYLWYSV
ncbi:MAG TPA: hypothetical protein VHB20_04080 [Verrucomicrobiae bacterium]|jgi:hypothetical protein|nr:hypothetical protein [Verrucomicrobiae bacterium]